MMPFSAKKEVMRTYLSRHEDKLRATPEDWALTIMDLAERPDLMYDQHTFEEADYARRSWGLHFEIEVEALAKLEDREREKQQSQHSVATGRRGMLWVAEQDNSPNWPLDDIVDENGVGLHDLKEQWTPVLDTHVDYDAIQYLYERYPEAYDQLENSDSPVELYMEDHLEPNTTQWMVARMIMELHLNKARRALHDLEAVEQHVQKATNVMAELDWEQRNTDRFPFGPIAETKRLAIIMTQKEQRADRRLIKALESQLSRNTRSIILEHERRDFVESWRNYHCFALVMFELLNAQCMPLEVLEAERCLVLRLEALERRGIIPTTEHYEIEQHFDLNWRRVRVYLARTRLPSPDAGKHEEEALADREAQADSTPAWGMSRTRAHMYSRARGGPNDLEIEGIDHGHDSDTFIDDGDDDDDRKPAAVEQQGVAGPTPVVAVAVQEGTDPDPMVTTAVAVIRPRTLHLLQPNEAEGTLLEGTVCDNLKRIQYWLNVTKLYVPICAVVARWLYGFGGGNGWQPVVDSVDSWLAWLKRHNADGSELELLRVAIEMKSALGVSSAQREIELRERERRLGITQPIVMGRLLSQAEYAVAQGDPSTPLTGGDPSAGKVAASGRSASLLNTDWMVRNCVGRGGSRYPPPLAISSHTTHPTKRRWIERRGMSER